MATKVAAGCGHNQSDQKGHSAKRQADSAQLAHSAARVAVYTSEEGTNQSLHEKGERGWHETQMRGTSDNQTKTDADKASMP